MCILTFKYFMCNNKKAYLFFNFQGKKLQSTLLSQYFLCFVVVVVFKYKMPTGNCGNFRNGIGVKKGDVQTQTTSNDDRK